MGGKIKKILDNLLFICEWDVNYPIYLGDFFVCESNIHLLFLDVFLSTTFHSQRLIELGQLGKASCATRESIRPNMHTFDISSVY